MEELLSEFAEALSAEIAHIEKDSRDQSYELLSGHLEEKATGSLYIFLLADVLRIPEDAAGTLKAGDREYKALVVAQEGNRIWLLIESDQPLPQYLPSARLVLNETQLLIRLREKIEQLRATGEFGLGPKVFGLEASSIGRSAIPGLIAGLDQDKVEPLEKCLGSEVTVLWGPPGTGKTYSIATLTAALTSLGETVLVTSHTHAAIEQALWATIEKPVDNRAPGPLFESPLVADGRVLKVGALKAKKIPPEVHLDSYIELRAHEREENLSTLSEEQLRVSKARDEAHTALEPWTKRREAESHYASAVEEWTKAGERSVGEKKALEAQVELYRSMEAAVEKASKSFFFGRGGRVARAQAELREFVDPLRVLRIGVATAEAELIRKRKAMEEATQRLRAAKEAATGLPNEATLSETYDTLNQRWQASDEQIRALRESEGVDATELLENAAALFVTLTKLYTDRFVDALQWDTVIIDEASMAMPPLVALAASHARRRVIVVGDMYQLPPIVQSPETGAGSLLSKDIFEMRGITDAIGREEDVPYLAKLTSQRRMLPKIASVARLLIPEYKHLTDKVDAIPPPDVLGSTDPLVFVDIAALHPWSAKMPGSLSRFNFLSGQASVEIAALYAHDSPMPEEDEAPRIGVVTPYAAQRRYLNRLVQTLELARWVTAGTVHTFQGNECEVIIFDSVLGEPHWTARLTNPHQTEEVRRDLNVAVTRARKQFVFVGDSKWLSQHAKAGSAVGKLWAHLQSNASHINASDLLGEGFLERVAQSSASVQGWQAASLPESAQLLTERNFYEAFSADLQAAQEQVILYTPYIGKTRWPRIEPLIKALRTRHVKVFLLHKPLSDPTWRDGDPDFGRTVFKSLEAIGVKLVPIAGVHAKTIAIDREIVYEGSLNWASQVASYEHMWRFKSRPMALLVEKMLRLEPMVATFAAEDERTSTCPKCGGPLMVVSQAQQRPPGDVHPTKLGCLRHYEDKTSCPGYLRRIDARAPYVAPPHCSKGSLMKIRYTKKGYPWAWECKHKGCESIRWVKGDCEKAEFQPNLEDV